MNLTALCSGVLPQLSPSSLCPTAVGLSPRSHKLSPPSLHVSAWVQHIALVLGPHCNKCICTLYVALFPGLHAQLLLLAVRKAGEGLDGLITWCVPRLTSRTVASHDRSSSNRTRRTNWTERTNWIQGKKSEGERTNPDVSRLNVMSAAAYITW